MVLIVVHWLIRKDKVSDFENRWRAMAVERGSGLYREVLSKLIAEPVQDKFHTFSIGDPFYTTYLNIGFWRSVDDFDRSIGKYIPAPRVEVEPDGSRRVTFSMEDFEFKMRERAVMEVVCSRGSALPPADLPLV